jgi:hypothetical protein
VALRILRQAPRARHELVEELLDRAVAIDVAVDQYLELLQR